MSTSTGDSAATATAAAAAATSGGVAGAQSDNPSSVSAKGGGASSSKSSSSATTTTAKKKGSSTSTQQQQAAAGPREVGHYVVTAHRPGCVLLSERCSFLGADTTDVVIAKACRLEVRQLRRQGGGTGGTTGSGTDTASVGNDADGGMEDEAMKMDITSTTTTTAGEDNPDEMKDDDDIMTQQQLLPTLPVILDLPVRGRICTMTSFRPEGAKTDFIFFSTERHKYAVISYDTNTQSVLTHDSGTLNDLSIGGGGCGREAECGPLLVVHHGGGTSSDGTSCLAVHLYDGYVKIIPVGVYTPPKPPQSVGMKTTGLIGKKKSSSASAKKKRGKEDDDGGGGRSGPHRGPFRGARVLLEPFNVRIDQQSILSMTFLADQRSHADVTPHPPTKRRNSGSGGGGGSGSKPRLALLYQDSRGVQHVIVHSVDMDERHLLPHTKGGGGSGTFRKSRIDAGSGLLIPIPPPPPQSPAAAAASAGVGGNTAAAATSILGGGIVIVGQNQITYLGPNGTGMKVLPMEHTLMLSYAPIVAAGGGKRQHQDDCRFLLGDDRGYLYVLAVLRDHSNHGGGGSGKSGAGGGGGGSGIVTSLHLETLGRTSIPSTIHFLGGVNGSGGGFGEANDAFPTIFIGSQFGDSQLLRLLPQRRGTTATDDDEGDEEPGSSSSYVELLEEYTNLGPIVDFDLVDMDRKGQCQVVTCSGTAGDGSIRLVRNGIGIHEQANVEIPGIKGMFNLRPSFSNPYDKYLVQSFIGETRILAITDDEMEETHIEGFANDVATLYACNVVQNCFVQVTERQVVLVDCDSCLALDTWYPTSTALEGDDLDSEEDASHSRITVATGNGSGQIMVALRGGVLVHLEVVSEGSSHVLSERGTTQLSQEVSCLNLHPFEEPTLPSTTGTGTTKNTTESSKKRKGGVDSDSAMMDIDDTTTTGTILSSSKEQHVPRHSSASRSEYVAVGLWNDFTVRILHLGGEGGAGIATDVGAVARTASGGHGHLEEVLLIELGGDTQARSLLMTVLEGSQRMLLVGLGDGQLISYFLQKDKPGSGTTPTTATLAVTSRKKVSLGTQSISLSSFRNVSNGNTCVFASGDRPTVVYMTNGKILYSNINLSNDAEGSGGGGGAAVPAGGADEVVNWVCPFHCELFPDCLCLASEEVLRIGTIDDIQKLHVQTWKLGESPRRIAHHRSGRVFVLGCISGGGGGDDHDGGMGGDANMGNSIRFLDDSTFDEIHRVDLDPFEMILSMISCNFQNFSTQKAPAASSASTSGSSTLQGGKPYVVVGTAYAYPDEDEPCKGRILVFECNNPTSSDVDASSGTGFLSRSVRQLTELHTRGGVYSMCPFQDGSLLATVNSKTNVYRWNDSDGVAELKPDGASHHGHILSLFVRNRGNLSIVGDLMRSISVMQYHDRSLIEVARDYNANWTTAVEMLSDTVYLGAENWNNLFTLRRNVDSTLEEVRCRLDTQGEYHLGEMVNKFARGSLVMPSGDVDGGIQVAVGSQTLFATVDGSIGVVLGLNRASFAFFRSLERSMAAEIPSVGNFSHEEFRAFVAERRVHPSRGFVDGDLVESFLDLSRDQMECVVDRMNAEGGWDLADDSANILSDDGEAAATTLSIEDVLNRVEEMSRLH